MSSKIQDGCRCMGAFGGCCPSLTKPLKRLVFLTYLEQEGSSKSPVSGAEHRGTFGPSLTHVRWISV